jgi:hypothetical protein
MKASSDDQTLHERIADLEARLRQVEAERSATGRTRSFMRRFVPDEAGHHFRAAGREQLMGMRALVDHWIRRLDAAEAKKPQREDIPID